MIWQLHSKVDDIFIHSLLPLFLKFIANTYSLIMRNLMSVGIQICIDLDYVLESKNGFNIQNLFKDLEM